MTIKWDNGYKITNTLKFNIGQKVITPFECEGEVCAVLVDDTELVSYQIRYFLDCKIHHEYFYEDELKFKV